MNCGYNYNGCGCQNYGQGCLNQGCVTNPFGCGGCGYQVNGCGTGNSWFAIVLVVFLLLIICGCSRFRG